MSHHIEDILTHWQRAPDDEWVLAVITKVQGSAYRKAGAMMLFHPLGRSIGLLSGGCLEADLRRHAQMAIEKQQAVLVQYDASDETDASYQLGCGGIVDIMLIPLKPENNYLNFHPLAAQLAHAGRCVYQIVLPQVNTALANVSAKITPYVEGDVMPDDVVCEGMSSSGLSPLLIHLWSLRWRSHMSLIKAVSFGHQARPLKVQRKMLLEFLG